VNWRGEIRVVVVRVVSCVEVVNSTEEKEGEERGKRLYLRSFANELFTFSLLFTVSRFLSVSLSFVDCLVSSLFLLLLLTNLL